MGKKRWEWFKTMLILRWYSVGLSVGSILYGKYLLEHPYTIQLMDSYEILNTILSSQVFAYLFIMSGMAKLIAVYFDWKRGRLLALSAIIILWTLFMLGFFLQGIVGGADNEKWIFLMVIVWTAWGVVQRSDFHA